MVGPVTANVAVTGTVGVVTDGRVGAVVGAVGSRPVVRVVGVVTVGAVMPGTGTPGPGPDEGTWPGATGLGALPPPGPVPLPVVAPGRDPEPGPAGVTLTIVGPTGAAYRLGGRWPLTRGRRRLPTTSAN